MPRVDPLYYALTRPVAPVGQAARGGSRLLSSLAPALMPMVDEYMDDPEVQGILSGWGKSAGDALGGEGSDISKLLEKAGPMMGRMAPRVGAAAGAEGLSLLGGALGAPEEMWDPGIRRQNMMMSMRMPGKGQPNTTGAGAGSDGMLDAGYSSAPEMFDLSSPSGTGVEDIGGGMGIDWGASFAGANVRGAPSGLKEPGGGGNSGSQLGQAVGGAVGGPAAGAGLGMAFGAVEDLAKAPGSMLQKGTDAATSTDGLRKALAQSSSTPPPAGNFGERMGKFDLSPTQAAGAEIPDAMAMWGESQPTTREAELMPRPPAPMGAAPRLSTRRSPGDDEFTSDNEFQMQNPEYMEFSQKEADRGLGHRYLEFSQKEADRGLGHNSVEFSQAEADRALGDARTFPTQRVQGRGTRGLSPASTGSGGGRREYTPPANIRRDYPAAKAGGLTPPNSAAKASSLLNSLQQPRSMDEEQINRARYRR